jgi:transcriptional regulator of acetoin/glycerol metabolism
VRELKNLVEAILVCPPNGRISLEDLPEHFQRKLAAVCRLPGDERRRLLEALVTTRWNKSKAAQLLHWSRMTLYRKMARHAVVCSIPPEDGRTMSAASTAKRRRAS